MLQQCRPDLKRRIEKKLARAALGGHISASDIVQDACEKVVENHAHFRGRSAGEWRMWVRKIATNGGMECIVNRGKCSIFIII